MSVSSLAKKHVQSPASNHWGIRKTTIKKIIIHHAAAVTSAEDLANLFAKTTRGASATYTIGNDGTIISCLDESITPGTSGGYEADKDAVTIEVANSQSGGQWPISDKALKSLVLLCADIAKRNKEIGKLVKGKNLCWHSMYQATACPGPYLLSKMEYIATEANNINFADKYEHGELSGTDKLRGHNELVVYFKGLTGNGKTGTNQWGYEVAIDKNGVVLETPHYSGNTVIPKGGKVLSGHNDAGKWIYSNIRKGDLVWFSDNTVKIARGNHRSVDSVNSARLAEYLVVYNKGTSTGTNIWGYEVAIDKTGKAMNTPVYGKGNMTIPSGGFVISGHNNAGKWIFENIKKGSTVTFDGKIISVK